MNKSLDDLRILRGMEKQLQFRQQRLQAGEKHVGWKVGFGAPASLERLQLQAPLVGFLTDKVLLPSGSTVSLSGWTQPAVEPEIAVYLGQDLAGNMDRDAAKAAIAAIGPAIELADVDFPPEDVERILAENIYNRHVILGNADPSRLGGQLDGLIAHISQNETALPAVEDLQFLTGDIINIVMHVAEMLHAFREKLQAGEFIIAGSIVPPLSGEPKGTITYSLAPIDTLRVTLA
jgi:2-keto-4-pentenoate hydratase